MVPRPDHASPVSSYTPGPSSDMPPDGRVITDFASMSNVNCRAVPSGIRSVYFDVSQRVIAGWFITFSRRSHFTFVLPSHPGSEEAQWVSLLGPQRLAVLRVNDKCIVHRLCHRHAARELARVGALCRGSRSRSAARRTPSTTSRAERRSTRCNSSARARAGRRSRRRRATRWRCCRSTPEKQFCDTDGIRFNSATVNTVGRSTRP